MSADASAELRKSTDAFTAFYDATVVDLLRYFTRAMAGDRALAEDLTQETYIAAMRAAQRGHPDATTWPYLIGVARHKLVDQHRRRYREDHKLALAHAAGHGGSSSCAEQSAEDTIMMLRSLSPDHRLVLVLRYLDDLPMQEVADLIGRSVRATESIVVRAKRALGASIKATSDV